MRRALERAGNRVKGRAGALRAATAGVDPVAACAAAGRALVADSGLTDDDLLAGAWDDLVVSYRTWVDAAVDETTGIVGGLVGEFTAGYPAAMKATYGRQIDDSVDYLRKGLSGIASQHLYDPSVLTPSGDLVPAGFVRQIVGIAGGHTDIQTSGFAYVAVTVSDKPIGGVGTGPTATRALTDHGAKIAQYRWLYGPARRSLPYEPHVHLDGATFETFDDPVLAADPARWPYVTHYIPGDHPHCKCDFEPVVVSAAQVDAIAKALVPPPLPPKPLLADPKKPTLGDLDATAKALDDWADAADAAGKPGDAAAARVDAAALRAKATAVREQTKANQKRRREAKAAAKAAPPVPSTDLGPRAGPRALTHAEAVEAAGRNPAGGSAFPFDGGDVEQLDVHVRSVLSAGTPHTPATEYRWKMTADGEARWRDRLAARSGATTLDVPTNAQGRGVWNGLGWKTRDGITFPATDYVGAGARPVVRAGSPLKTAGGGTLRFDGTTLVRDFEVGGRRVYAEVALSRSRDSFALRNQVRILVDGEPDDALFAEIVDRLGLTDKVRHPTRDDVRAYAENALIRTLGRRRGTLSLSERRDALAEIATRFGITPADVTVGTQANGSVAAELTDEALQRVVDETGVTFFTHRLGNSTTERVATVLADDHGGLISTTQRWNDGIPVSGMSSSSDVESGGADFVFTRQQGWDAMGRGQDAGTVVYHNSRLRTLDWFAYDSDNFGRATGGTYDRTDFVEALRAGKGRGSQETMFRHRVSWDDAVAIWVDDPEGVKARLHDQGIHFIGGRPLDEFILRQGQMPPGGAVQPRVVPGAGRAAAKGAATAAKAAAPPAHGALSPAAVKSAAKKAEMFYESLGYTPQVVEYLESVHAPDLAFDAWVVTKQGIVGAYQADLAGTTYLGASPDKVLDALAEDLLNLPSLVDVLEGFGYPQP